MTDFSAQFGDIFKLIQGPISCKTGFIPSIGLTCVFFGDYKFGDNAYFEPYQNSYSLYDGTFLTKFAALKNLNKKFIYSDIVGTSALSMLGDSLTFPPCQFFRLDPDVQVNTLGANKFLRKRILEMSDQNSFVFELMALEEAFKSASNTVCVFYFPQEFIDSLIKIIEPIVTFTYDYWLVLPKIILCNKRRRDRVNLIYSNTLYTAQYLSNADAAQLVSSKYNYIESLFYNRLVNETNITTIIMAMTSTEIESWRSSYEETIVDLLIDAKNYSALEIVLNRTTNVLPKGLLTKAIRRESLECAKLLLEINYSINDVDMNDVSALENALNFSEAFDYLLAISKNNPFTTTILGKALWEAVNLRKDVNIIKKLLDVGANPEFIFNQYSVIEISEEPITTILETAKIEKLNTTLNTSVASASITINKSVAAKKAAIETARNKAAIAAAKIAETHRFGQV